MEHNAEQECAEFEAYWRDLVALYRAGGWEHAKGFAKCEWQAARRVPVLPPISGDYEPSPMTAGRASYFMERFLKEEKMLGPNEQAALHYVISMLSAAPQPPEAAPTAQQGLEQWQPIETAPKVPTILLGYRNSHGKWRTTRGCWFTKDQIEETWEDGDMPEGWYETPAEGEECFFIEPTHWQPLPPAPAAGLGG